MAIDTTPIKKQAEELIDKYVLTVPVHMFELADLMGIKWQSTSTERLKKIIERKSNKKDIIPNWEDVYGYFDHTTKTIYLNDENQSITRQRFTIAHEIGHMILHHNLQSLMRKIFLRQDVVVPRDEIEAEANYFAGYLLMPDGAIEDRLKYTVLMIGGEQIIKKFAKLFAVSPEAMRVRFKTFKKEYPELWATHNLEEKLF